MGKRKRKILVGGLVTLTLLLACGIAGIALLAPDRHLGRTVADWATDLESPDDAVREAAVTRLVLAGEDAAPLLVKILEPPSSRAILLGRAPPDLEGFIRCRREVTRVAEVIGRPAVPPLVRIVRGGEPSARRIALELLAAAGPGSLRARDAARAALTDGDASVRETAVRTLVELDPVTVESRAALRERLEDADLDVRVAAAAALWELTHDPSGLLPALLEDLARPDGPQASGVLEEVGEEAAPAARILGELLAHPRVETRLVAGRVLGTMGESASPALPALETALATEEESEEADALRGAAALALVGADPAHVAGRRHLFRRVHEDGSRKAALLLWRTGRERERLVRLLLWPRGERAPMLPRVIEEFGVSNVEAVPVLTEVLRSPAEPAEGTVLAAITCLGLVGPPAESGVPLLRDAMASGGHVASCAALAYWRVTGRGEEPLRVLRAILAGEDGASVAAQTAAVVGLATMASRVPEASEDVRRATEHENRTVRIVAAEALRRMPD